MRDIRFRGKVISNTTLRERTLFDNDNAHRWIYGSLVILNGRTFIFNDEERCEVDSATVGQLTGLKDRTGREIYEGDLFKAGYHDVIFRVEWDEVNARYIGRSEKGSIAYVGREPAIEVLGNIHDNPDLLTES